MGFFYLVVKLFVIIVWFIVFVGGVGDWSYCKFEDVSMWKYYFEYCVGYKQLLINIVFKEIIFDVGFKDFVVNFEYSVLVSL